MTGFRVAPAARRSSIGIQPDLTTLGKVIGGGLPIAAYGGRKDIMSHVAPSGPFIRRERSRAIRWRWPADWRCCAICKRIRKFISSSTRITAQLAGAAPDGVTVNRVGSMMTWFFTEAGDDYTSAPN